MKVGFIGLGRMGLALASHLLRNGPGPKQSREVILGESAMRDATGRTLRA